MFGRFQYVLSAYQQLVALSAVGPNANLLSILLEALFVDLNCMELKLRSMHFFCYNSKRVSLSQHLRKDEKAKSVELITYVQIKASRHNNTVPSNAFS